MTTGLSLALLAIGAILTFALGSNSFGGVNIDLIGIILMIVGAIGLIMAMMFWNSPAGGFRRERRIIREDEIIP